MGKETSGLICGLYNMRVRKLLSDNSVECSGNCRECAVSQRCDRERWCSRPTTVEQRYWIVRRLKCHTVHRRSVSPASSIRDVGHGQSLSWCADDQIPWWDRVMRWQRTSDERWQWHDKRAAEPRCSDRDSATLEARRLSEHCTGRHKSLNMLSDGKVVCHVWVPLFFNVEPQLGESSLSWTATVQSSVSDQWRLRLMEIIEQRQYCWGTAIPFSTVFITFILVQCVHVRKFHYQKELRRHARIHEINEIWREM